MNERLTEGVIGAADSLGRAKKCWSIFLSLFIGKTKAHQELPSATPTIEEQVTPTRAVTSWTTTPSPAKILETAGLSACWTLWQHCKEPVLLVHWLAGSFRRVGVATARVARARVTRESLNCILNLLEELERCSSEVSWRNAGLLRNFVSVCFLICCSKNFTMTRHILRTLQYVKGGALSIGRR